MIDIADLIPSKDVRQYMEKQGRVLTDYSCLFGTSIL